MKQKHTETQITGPK